jgi:hypothetical protein
MQLTHRAPPYRTPTRLMNVTHIPTPRRRRTEGKTTVIDNKGTKGGAQKEYKLHIHGEKGVAVVCVNQKEERKKHYITCCTG